MSDAGIRIGAAGNQAAQMLHGIATRGDLTMDQISGFYSELVSNLVDVMNALEAGQPSATPVAQAFEQAFPNTTVVEQPHLAAVPAPVAAAPAAAAPPAVPGVAQNPEEELWKAFFADPSAWYDNRFDKKNPNGPDFKSKTIPQPDNPQYKAGLWIGGRTQPAWVGPQLEAIGMNK